MSPVLSVGTSKFRHILNSPGLLSEIVTSQAESILEFEESGDVEPDAGDSLVVLAVGGLEIES